jgi:hypothetical protein
VQDSGTALAVPKIREDRAMASNVWWGVAAGLTLVVFLGSVLALLGSMAGRL